jgi:hypothetical protein
VPLSTLAFLAKSYLSQLRFGCVVYEARLNAREVERRTRVRAGQSRRGYSTYMYSLPTWAAH